MIDSSDKRLYVVHLGFYDQETNFGVYESHTNIFVAAADPRDAKQIVKAMSLCRDKKMHVDGIQEINSVQGFRIKLEKDKTLNDATQISSFGYTELNAETSSSSAS